MYVNKHSYRMYAAHPRNIRGVALTHVRIKLITYVDCLRCTRVFYLG